MTTFCRIVLTVVTCTADPATPRPTPAEAVAIFSASSPPFHVMTEIEPLPWYVDAPIASGRDWPFAGSFAPTPRADPTWAPTLRRLDGTSIFDPPMVYGFVPRGHGGWYGTSGHVYSGVAGRPQRGTGPDVRAADRDGLPRHDKSAGAPGGGARARGPLPAGRAAGQTRPGAGRGGGVPGAPRR